ncbi:hypothetical protein HDC37_000805 [Microbacterium sp. AK009]|uniref:hypothetical protein n=1 Tax=Microbacterium sp. AK009 TaxID=2723068 RepID=UPI0015CA040B|nr:hypothetical protein [Microbacterium sp. AK009]NYF15991.1 hypothetical protein [Microbacterium sp. AK009]
MGKSPRVRFAFRITDGPNAGLTVGRFIVWCHGNDTYIADGDVPSWKTSLHGEVAWRTAETKESNRSTDARLPEGVDRAPWKYAPPDFVGGHRRAFVIGVTRGALGRWTVPDRYETIQVRDRWDELTKANVWMSQPGTDIPDPPERVGPVLELTNGMRVWVGRGSEELEAIDPEPVPVSAIIEPQIPGVDDVTAPGILIRGVHLAPPDQE